MINKLNPHTCNRGKNFYFLFKNKERFIYLNLISYLWRLKVYRKSPNSSDSKNVAVNTFIFKQNDLAVSKCVQ